MQGKPGPVVKVDQVEVYPDADLYDPSVLRTIFLEFENEDWEEELAVFKPTDVEVPAAMIVDGETYPNVGVSFRGASSFFRIPAGGKRSLNLSVDFVDDDQRLHGYKTLNLLNCNGDSSMMSSLLYQDIARKKIAAPKVNFVKVVINGRSWGVYANAQQFNKDFAKENYGTKKGARWKVTGSPRGDGGLRYLGEEVEPYRERFEIKSKDEKDSWNDLIELCRVIDETPPAELESALKPILDVDGVLWFLAVDIALCNSDGYWTRASDYNIYQDPDGVFHILPHDMNEAFRGSHGGGPGGGRRGRGGFGFGIPGFRPPGFGPPGFDGPERGRPQPGQDARGGNQRPARPGAPDQQGRGGRPTRPGGPDEQGRGGRPGGPGPGGPGRGPGGPGGPGAGGIELDPLVGLEDPRFPLRSKLLANKDLKRRYLQYVRAIADDYLDWEYLGPKVADARELIAKEVQADTKKLMSNEAFQNAVNDEKGSLREFADKRREYLLKATAKALAETQQAPR